MEQYEVPGLAHGTGAGQDRKRPRKNPGSTTRRPMLNIRNMVYFRNELKEIVLSSEMEDNIKASFMATVIAKSSNMSIPEAKAYINEMETRGQVPPQVAYRVARLLDRYTKHR